MAHLQKHLGVERVVGFLGAEGDSDDGPYSPEIRLTQDLPEEARVGVTNRFFVPRNCAATTVVGVGLPFEDAPSETTSAVLNQWCAYLNACLVSPA